MTAQPTGEHMHIELTGKPTPTRIETLRYGDIFMLPDIKEKAYIHLGTFSGRAKFMDINDPIVRMPTLASRDATVFPIRITSIKADPDPT